MTEPDPGIASWQEDPTKHLEVMELNISIGDEQFELDVHEDVRIDSSRIIEECRNHPNVYAYYSTLYRSAQRQYQQAEREFDKWYAQHDRALRYRDQDPDDDFTYSTETQLKEYIKSLDDYHDKKEELIDARYVMKQLKNVVKALEQRRNMLITLEKREREEQEYERQTTMPKDTVEEDEDGGDEGDDS